MPSAPGPALGADELVPDVTLAAVGADPEDPQAVAQDLVDRMQRVDGVLRATVDPSIAPDLLVHLTLADGSGARPLDAVTADARSALIEALPAAEVLTGGTTIEDQALSRRFDRSAGAVAWVAALAGLALGAVFGWRRGAAAGVTLGLAVMFAGGLGRQLAGEFDGTMASTAFPAALAGLVVAVTLTARLLVWFRRPIGDDGADRIRRAIADLGPELAVLLAGAIATSLLVDLLGPGRSALTVATTGAVVATAVVLAVLVPALTLLEDDEEGPAAHLAPVDVLDGRELPLLVVALGVVGLAVLSVAATGRLAGPLLDGSHLDQSGEPARVTELAARAGGDPTGALVAFADGAAAADFEAWIETAAQRSGVGWIDTGSRRVTATGPVDVADSALLVPADRADVAVVVLSVPPRSAEGQLVPERLAAVAASGQHPQFAGTAAVSGDLAGSRTPVLVTIVALAVIGAAGAQVLTGNRAVALTSFLLRLGGGGATVGLYNLVAGDPTMAEALTLLAAVGLGSLLSEFEVLRRFDIESDPSPLHELLDPAAADGHRAPSPAIGEGNPGQFGVAGLVVLGVAGLAVVFVAPFGGGPGAGRLGVALLLAGAVEIAVGAMMLRPALLAQGPAFHTAVRPLRVALHGRSIGEPAGGTPPDDDPGWRRVVGELLEAEFRFQIEPERAELSKVFVADTPVHRQAVEHHVNLARSGLRIVGRSPRLRSLRTIRHHSPVTLAVTVDHPGRQLLDPEGHVVGVRRPERRSGWLWLTFGTDGVYRIAESVERGAELLDEESTAQPAADDGADAVIEADPVEPVGPSPSPTG